MKRTGRGAHPDGLKVKALVPIGLSANPELTVPLLGLCQIAFALRAAMLSSIENWMGFALR
jgi:hypothetical protein